MLAFYLKVCFMTEFVLTF